jgi:cyanophycin synthetase
MTTTEGTYINHERIVVGDNSGPRSARTVLLHPRVEVAVLETARGGILREGLAFDMCSVGVVTNISRDHLGKDGINTLEDLARVKQVVIEAVSKEGAAVLNADDPFVAEMAAATDGRIVYFGASLGNPVIAAHFAEGGWCVFIEDNAIVVAAQGIKTELVSLERVSFTAAGKIPFQVMNALAATAAAWAEGLNPAMIVRALTTFKSDESMMPGRFNVSNLNGVEIVLDYGHNAAAITALGQAVQALGSCKTVMVLALPGDRPDEDLRATVKASLSFVDEYVLHDLGDRRGRAPNEVPELLASCLPKEKRVEYAADQAEAIEKCWQRVQRGDRLVVIADIVDETLDILQHLTQSVSHDSACETPLSPEFIEEK